MATRVCLLSHKEASRLTNHGIRPSCFRHEHLREEEAERLLELRSDGVRQMREVFLYRTVHINGVPKQVKDGSVRRVTFQDTVTWVKVYGRAKGI